MCRRFRWFELLLRLTRPLRLLPPLLRSKIRGPQAPLRTVPKLRTRVGKAQGGGDGDGVPGGDVPKILDDGGDGEDYDGPKDLRIHSNLLKFSIDLTVDL